MAQVYAMLGMEPRTSACIFNYKYDINKVKSQRRGKGSRNRVKSKNGFLIQSPSQGLDRGSRTLPREVGLLYLGIQTLGHMDTLPHICNETWFHPSISFPQLASYLSIHHLPTLSFLTHQAQLGLPACARAINGSSGDGHKG